MPSKVLAWTPKQFKENLAKRLKQCKQQRDQFDTQWWTNGNVMYNAIPQESNRAQMNITFDNVIELESGEVDEGDSTTGTNYVFKFVRHKHGMLSANPPSSIARPTSPDITDRRAADAADRIIRHGYHDKKVQEVFDQALLKVLVRGTGWVKLVWDPDRGDVVDYNEATSEILMAGDIHTYSPSTFDIWVDPLAKTWEEVRYVIERHILSYEEARFKFPDAEDVLKTAILKNKESQHQEVEDEDTVEIYEYYEKGMPLNGMAGRRAFFVESGELLSEPTKNPHYQARLPYHYMTEIDVEDQIYGKSNIEYVSRKQDLLNRFDSASVDAMEAHGVIRLAIPEGAEINDDEISNSNYDIIRYSGAIPPNFVNPPALPPDLPRLRDQMRADIQDVMGINDSMLGIQKREQSGFSQQTSIEAGSVSNRRTMNKYTNMVKSFWQDYIGLVRENWTIPRTILVLGKEKAFESKDIKGADIAGGFDVIVEYGQSLPMEPNMRREQILLLMQPLQQAGIPMVRILKMLKLNDLDTLYDELEQAEDRQREIFEEMMALAKDGNSEYIAPQELENHDAMLIFCQKFRNSMEYKVLPEDVKPLIEQHIKDRMGMAAQVGAQGQQAAPAPGPEAPPPPAPPGPPVQ